MSENDTIRGTTADRWDEMSKAQAAAAWQHAAPARSCTRPRPHPAELCIILEPKRGAVVPDTAKKTQLFISFCLTFGFQVSTLKKNLRNTEKQCY